MQKYSVQKLITFSPQLYDLVEKKAKKLGLTFPEYIRLLAVNDIKNMVEDNPFVDTKTEKHIAHSIKNINSGKYTILNSSKDIEDHFGSRSGTFKENK